MAFTPDPSPAPAGEGSSPPDTGLLGLVMLARYHGVAAEPEQLAHEFREAGRPFGIPEVLLAAGG